MNAVIFTDARLFLNQGRPASPYLTYDRVWSRYLSVFDSVTVVARQQLEEHPSASPVEGPGVSVHALPSYRGVRQYLQMRGRLVHSVEESYNSSSAYILRLPSTVAGIAWRKLQMHRHPYSVEVIGDPYYSLAPESCAHPAGRILRHVMANHMAKQCRKAQCAAYVTERAIQRRYPCPGGMAGISDVLINDDSLANEVRNWEQCPNPATMVLVGGFNYRCKGAHILIDALALCVKSGLNARLAVVGEGVLLPDLKRQAAERGILARIDFRGGMAAGAAIRNVLDQCDLFVLPSFTEGLPRAMVEAMARALPCIGTAVGGVPELLSANDMVPPSDVIALAAKIKEVLSNPARMQEMSRRNLQRAREYHAAILEEKRRRFYRVVRDGTSMWLNGNSTIDVKIPLAATFEQAR